MWTTMLVATLAVGAPSDRELLDRIVAVVNDEVITLSEVEASAKPYMQHNEGEERKKLLFKDILDQLISERLLAQEIKQAKITVSDEEVSRAVKDILRQNRISEEQLKQAIESRGMSMGQYREDLKSQLVRLKLIDMKVRSRVVIPEADIKAEYDQRTKDDEQEELVHIRHIFFKWGENATEAEKAAIRDKAVAARKQALSGDFEAVAKELSEGPTRNNGGDLGELSGKQLLPELKVALEGVEPGTITNPIDTANGVHVVYLVGRRFKKPNSYAELRDRIYQEMYQRRVEEQTKVWLEELRGQSAVRVLL
ncbi:MAG: peptidylprolyl isomerase [Deltaproteobacteria bacterium]|jgi:peptidyl-prolyl cis-trans isomerase SurA